MRAPGQGFEPRSSRSGRDVLAVGRSRKGSGGGSTPSVHPAARVDAAAHIAVRQLLELWHGRTTFLRTMLFMPLAYTSTLDRRNTASYVEELWSPALHTLRVIGRQKPRLIQQRIHLRSERSRTFLSQAGPRVSIVVFQAEHHLARSFAHAPPTTKATLSGRPHSKRQCEQRTSSHASGRGPASRRTSASRSS